MDSITEIHVRYYPCILWAFENNMPIPISYIDIKCEADQRDNTLLGRRSIHLSVVSKM